MYQNNINLETIITELRKHLNFQENFIFKVILSLIILLVLWITRKVILKVSWKNIENIHSRYKIQKTSSYIAYSLAFILIGRVWFEVFQSLATLLGLLSAGIAIALKDIILDIAGWIYIIVKRPFEVGDRIQIGDFAGDVVDIQVFKFTLVEIRNWVHADQSTGRLIHIPNDFIFSKSLASFNKGFEYIWDEIPVLLTFESNWKKAKILFTRIINDYEAMQQSTAKKQLREASKKFAIYYSKLTPIVYLSVEKSGIELTLRYLCEPKKRRGVTQDLWEKILDTVQSNDDINLAYPTVRIYRNDLEQYADNNGYEKPQKPDIEFKDPSV